MRHGDHLRQSMLHENNLPLGAHVVSETKVSGIRWRANQLVWNSKLSNVNIMGFTYLNVEIKKNMWQRKMHSVQEPRFWDQICSFFSKFSFQFVVNVYKQQLCLPDDVKPGRASGKWQETCCSVASRASSMLQRTPCPPTPPTPPGSPKKSDYPSCTSSN